MDKFNLYELQPAQKTLHTNQVLQFYYHGHQEGWPLLQKKLYVIFCP